MSLFGVTATAQKPSIFGALHIAQSPQQSGNGVFGSTGNSQPQPSSNTLPLNQTSSAGSFGASIPLAQQPGGIFGAPQQQQQQQQQSGLFSLGNSTQQTQQFPVGHSTFGTSQLQPQSGGQPTRSSLWQPENAWTAREKSIPEQMQTLLEKWSPESNSCMFQRYFYNNVQTEAVPYYGPTPGEDEQKWEEALAQKPSEGSIPVLCKGFSALGNRLKIQVQSAGALQSRLHEINNSLAAMLQNHDLDISVRAVDAKRRHMALSQRCLQLATKVQVLRNRGYAMDSTEEELKKSLTDLESRTFDPQLSGKQDEIWARLVEIRERARFLQEETEKAGGSLQEGHGEAIDDDIMKRTKKILGDYDSQIAYLQREIDEVGKDFGEWESDIAAGRSRT